jgi:hypothetical protein
MARNGFLLLLVLNLLFFGWSRFIPGRSADTPAQALVAAAMQPPPVAEPPPPVAEPPSPPVCTSIGPYATEDAAFAVAAKLAASGRQTSLRAADEEVADGYWVYIEGLPDTDAQRMTVARIKRAGINDASAMPNDPAFRVSVGLFSQRGRAEQRAAAVKKLNLSPQVGEHLSNRSRFWIDLAGIAPQDLGPEVLLEAGIDNVPGELVTCP